MLKRPVSLLFSVLLTVFGWGQTAQTLPIALTQLKKDPQFAHAHVGWVVRDMATGKVITAHNSQDMFIPASVLKTITAAYTLQALGDTFHYRTQVDYVNHNGIVRLVMHPSYDPCLGSHRFKATQPDTIWKNISARLAALSLYKIALPVIMYNPCKDETPINGHWLWCDLANYYAASAMPFNWRENFYTVHFSTGNSDGAAASMLYSTDADSVTYTTDVKTTTESTTDDAYIYYDVNNPHQRIITGTLPAGKTDFTIKGTDVHPFHTFSVDGVLCLKQHRFTTEWNNASDISALNHKPLLTLVSPSLSTLIHETLKHSINLYAEAFIQTANNINPMQAYKAWIHKTVKDSSAYTLYDACGLSPMNRITPFALTDILLSAEAYKYVLPFHTYLPQVGRYFIKDGYMQGVRCMVGYYKSKTGGYRTFALMLNDIQQDDNTYNKVLAFLQSITAE